MQQGVEFAHDALGRMTSERSHVYGGDWTLSYQYNERGDLTRLTYPDSQYVKYNRDYLGRLWYAETASAPLFNPNFDSAGRQTSLQRWNYIAQNWGHNYSAYAYDGISRLSQLGHEFYSTSNDTTTSLTYNPAGQIHTRTNNNDAYAWGGHVNLNRGYASNGLNQYGAAGPVSLAYDANGNLTWETGGSGGNRGYSYDVENRLVWLTANSANAAAAYYDPLGRLAATYDFIAGTSQHYLHSGDDLVAEYAAGTGTMLRRFVHGTGAGDDPRVWFEGSSMAAGTQRYLFADERGSIVAVTDGAGGVFQINTYEEYACPEPVEGASPAPPTPAGSATPARPGFPNWG